MRILLQTPGSDTELWRAALAAVLPQARIMVWPDVPADPDYALVWRPPSELFATVKAPKAIFNLGAGVDALLAVPTLPADVPVIRLTDAGMAEQMAEYARHVPLSRVSRPEDCANLVSFLCSEQGGWINGQLLHSNGGVQ